MHDQASAEGLLPRPSFTEWLRGAHAMELWRLRGATDDLRGLAVETSFGYALGLELDAEVVFLVLQSSLETLVENAERIETALKAQGWAVVPTGDGRSDPR